MCANLSDRKITIDMMISEGDFITVRSTWSGTFSGTFRGTQFSGKNIHIVYTNIYRIAGGRIAENWYTANGLDLADQFGMKLVSSAPAGDKP
jgi:predicted ester cyclase